MTRENENSSEHCLNPDCQRFFELTLDYFVISDLQFKTLKVNPATLVFSGYAAEEIVGKSMLDFIHPEDKGLLEKAAQDILLKGRDLIHFEIRHRHKSGAYVWIEWSSRPDLAAGLVYSSGRDVNERKLLEKALQSSEERFRTLFESMGEGFALCEMIYDQEGRPCDYLHLDVNPAFCKLTGLTFKQVAGRRVTEAIPGLEKFWIEAYARVVESGQAARVEYQTKALEKQFEAYAWKVGEKRFAVLFSDITARKSREDELKWKTAFLEAQSEASLDGKLVVDAANRILSINKRLIDLFGIPEEIARNKDDSVLLEFVRSQVKDSEVFLDKVKHLYAHPDESSRDVVVFANGMIFDRYSTPVVDREGHTYGRIWTFRDITENKRQEEELKARLEEIERHNKLMIGREKRVIELKKEIDALCRSKGEPPRYGV